MPACRTGGQVKSYGPTSKRVGLRFAESEAHAKRVPARKGPLLLSRLFGVIVFDEKRKAENWNQFWNQRPFFFGTNRLIFGKEAREKFVCPS